MIGDPSNCNYSGHESEKDYNVGLDPVRYIHGMELVFTGNLLYVFDYYANIEE